MRCIMRVDLHVAVNTIVFDPKRLRQNGII